MTGFYATPERLAQLANNHILLEGGEPDYSQLVERFRKLYAENRP